MESQFTTIEAKNPKSKTKNAICSQKYSIFTILFVVLYNQFSSFFDLLLLLIALSQCISIYKVSPIISNLAPLILVIVINLATEANDDYKRYQKDQLINNSTYTIFELKEGTDRYVSKKIKAQDIKDGHILLLKKNERVPADTILLKNLEENSQVFIRTDQLDGETDWKLKVPIINKDCPAIQFKAKTDDLFQNLDNNPVNSVKNLVGEENTVNESKMETKTEKNIDKDIFAVDATEKNTKTIEIDDMNVQSKEEKISKDKTADENPIIKTSYYDNLCDLVVNNSTVSINQKQIISGVEIDKQFVHDLKIKVEKPHKDIYSFIGNVELSDGEYPANYENTLWMNTIVASGTVLAATIYTGKNTRPALNTARARCKSSIVDSDINKYTVLLAIFSFIMAVIGALVNDMTNLSQSHIVIVKFVVIYSGIIPLSLKVSLNYTRMIFYNRKIELSIKGAVVRSTNIPEDLGKINYFLTDKTGTLTRNEMVMKKIHLGAICYSTDLNPEIKKMVTKGKFVKSKGKAFSKRKDYTHKIKNMVEALSICHNVTPVEENGLIEYQAASPDEVAIVQWCELVGFRLIQRTQEKIIIQIENNENQMVEVDILYVFPFTSETKRMGIIVRIQGKIMLYMKGADMVMTKIITNAHSIDEDVGLMAREGLRTLVIASKEMSEEEFTNFATKYEKAKLSINRSVETLQVQEELEKNLTLLGLTGVEDKLQDNVMLTLEQLKNAGIKPWMLTGDKIETAISIAQSTKLFLKGRQKILEANNRSEAFNEIEDLANGDYIYAIINGSSLKVFLEYFPNELILALSKMESVVACRCTPTQKADLAELLRVKVKKIVLGIGDGGNDVSMITSANVGVGIVGKEGNAASLAADYSILKFADVSELILWHGRNCYTNTARLVLFIMHRGMLISFVQGIFCATFNFRPFSLFQGPLAIAFVCVFTAFPMFCLVNYEKIKKRLVFRFPELYKELLEHDDLSMKALSVWITISFYQAASMMITTFIFCKGDLNSITTIVYCSMVINELLIILSSVGIYAIEVVYVMLGSIIILLACVFFGFGELRIEGKPIVFFGKILLINTISIVIIVIRMLYTKIFNPETYHKLTQN